MSTTAATFQIETQSDTNRSRKHVLHNRTHHPVYRVHKRVPLNAGTAYVCLRTLGRRGYPFCRRAVRNRFFLLNSRERPERLSLTSCKRI